MAIIEKILDQALKLSPVEKSKIIDRLIESLDQPDEELDKLWMEESESRIAAYERGEIKTGFVKS